MGEGREVLSCRFELGLVGITPSLPLTQDKGCFIFFFGQHTLYCSESSDFRRQGLCSPCAADLGSLQLDPTLFAKFVRQI